MRKMRLLALAVLGLALIAAGCVDNLTWFDKTPVTVTLTVVDGDGDPVANAFVQMVGEQVFSGTTNANGVVSFSNVTPPQQFSVIVNAQYVDDLNVWGGRESNKTVTFVEKPNLLQNGSFEDLDEDGNPVGWSTRTWGGSAVFEVVPGAGRDGGVAVKIHSNSGADAGWAQQVTLQRGVTYRISGWIKAVNFDNNTGRGAQFSSDTGQMGSATPPITEDTDGWVFVTHTFTLSGSGSVNDLIIALFGGWGQSIGTVYFDDVRLTVE